MDDLIKSYQDTITALHRRRDELQSRVNSVRGEEYFKMCKRIDCLYAEEQDTLYALKMAVRSLK